MATGVGVEEEEEVLSREIGKKISYELTQPELDTCTGVYKCRICDKPFSSLKAFRSHRVNRHGIKVRQAKRSGEESFIAGCPVACCQASLTSLLEFKRHMTEMHELECDNENIEFVSRQDFLFWKEHLENSSSTKFYIASQASANRYNEKRTDYSYYSCAFQLEQNRREKLPRNSKQATVVCPASMVYQDKPDGSGMLRAFLTHSKHELIRPDLTSGLRNNRTKSKEWLRTNEWATAHTRVHARKVPASQSLSPPAFKFQKVGNFQFQDLLNNAQNSSSSASSSSAVSSNGSTSFSSSTGNNSNGNGLSVSTSSYQIETSATGEPIGLVVRAEDFLTGAFDGKIPPQFRNTNQQPRPKIDSQTAVPVRNRKIKITVTPTHRLLIDHGY